MYVCNRFAIFPNVTLGKCQVQVIIENKQTPPKRVIKSRQNPCRYFANFSTANYIPSHTFSNVPSSSCCCCCFSRSKSLYLFSYIYKSVFCSCCWTWSNYVIFHRRIFSQFLLLVYLVIVVFVLVLHDVFSLT